MRRSRHANPQLAAPRSAGSLVRYAASLALVVALGLAVSASLVSCTARSEGESQAGAPTDAADVEGAQPSADGEDAVQTHGARDEGTIAEPGPESGSPGNGVSGTHGEVFDLPRFLLAGGELMRIVPYDAEIGELPDTATAGRAYVALRRVVEGFFGGLHDPSGVVADYVLDTEQVRVARMIESDLPVDSSPRVRFGHVRWLGGDQAIMRVRLVDEAARTSGDVMLEQKGDDWRIVDVMVSLRELEPVAAGPAARLEPWIDQSPLLAP